MNRNWQEWLKTTVILALIGQASTALEPRIIGYSMNPAMPIVLDHASKHITDLVYFSVQVRANSTIDESGLTPEGLDAVQVLIEDRGVRVHLAVGGWGRSEHFAAACESAESRARLIKAIIKICKAHKLSGVDYDWEFPKSEDENALYAALIIESKAAFVDEGLEVSAAFSPWQKFDPEVYAAIDRVHLMAYDNKDKHSTLEDAEKAASGFLEKGVPPEKLFLGVPFYGRAMEDSERSITYRNVLAKHDLAPEIDEVDGYYYNGPVTIASKVQIAIDLKLGGIMIWELGQDVTGDQSLVKTIDRVFNSDE